MRKLLLTLLLTTFATSAQAEFTLDQLVDGETWQAKASNGRKLKLTFNEDGTAKLRRGIMSLKIGWQIKDNTFCLTNIPWDDEQCMTPKKTQDGFLLTDTEGEWIRLSR